MFRLILIIAAALIIGLLLRIGLRQLRSIHTEINARKTDFEPTTQCPHCGVHVPKASLDAGNTCPQCRQ